jgi:hypothetical protein
LRDYLDIYSVDNEEPKNESPFTEMEIMKTMLGEQNIRSEVPLGQNFADLRMAISPHDIERIQNLFVHLSDW